MKRRSLFGKISLFLIVSSLALAVLIAAYLFQGSIDGEKKALVIKRGSSINSIVKLLGEEEVVQWPTAFKILLRVTQGSTRVRHGEYEFQVSMRPLDAIRVLYFSPPVMHQITVPEGWTIRQIAAELENKGLGDGEKFISLSLNKKAARKHGLSTPHLEGFMFPDTYNFSRTDSEEQMVAAMVGRFFEKYKSYESEARRKGYSIERLVTLASVVEKETGAAHERPKIASVFLNRLKKRMRLESDPTTIYGIKNFDGNLTKKHLQTRTAYNTYRMRGLPAGPISNPGEEAIRAVLRPAETDYLFFVSRNDGTHVFTKTYKEHSYYVDLHQRGIVRKNKR